MTEASKKRTLKFKTEVTQLLDLMIHSLYSNREVFLRELISNSSDALDKLRFASLSDESMLENNSDFNIWVSIDEENNKIIIEDNGIGMTEQEVIDNIGTIANSGTKKYLEELTKSKQAGNDLNQIGQFGVGFYASFMVAEVVTLETRKAGDPADTGVLWTSKGDGNFALQTIEKPTRGTRVTLTLREDAKEFLDDWKVKSIINQYSEHLPFSVLMPKKQEAEETNEEDDTNKDSKDSKDNKDNKDVKQNEEQNKKAETIEYEAVNSAKALWLRSPKEIKDEEYEEFYKHISHDFEAPLAHIHNRVEGNLEYSSLLFIPKRAPFDLFDRECKKGLKLYVKRVFIMDETESLLPQWLRFVRGVIDCSDLPLNVSREILQDNQIVRKIKAALIKRVIDNIQSMANAENSEDFTTFWQQFGKVIKEGVVEDFDNKEKIAGLLRFSSTTEDAQTISLQQYIDRMKPEQETIFYLCAESLPAAKASPHLEILLEKGIEVLLLTDRIDEWVTSHLNEFNGKKLQSVNSIGDQMDELDKIESIEKEDKDDVEEVVDCKELLEKLKESLKDRVSDVKESKRLRKSPACVVSDNNQMTHNMQKIMQAMGQEMQEIKPILEINPQHPIILNLANNPAKSNEDFNDWATLLLDQALLSEGASLVNPGDFVASLNKLLSRSL